jgi:hypothetical protein
MANSRDFTGKNRKFTGTKGVVMPKGSTAERADTESGEIRFNTTTELMEYYDGNQWKPIDAPPTISSITTNDATGSATDLNADGSTLFTVTINGGNFSLSPNVKFIGNTGTEYTAGNINRVSNSSITCTTVSNMGTSDDPYDVQVINTSGLSATLDDALTFNAPPVFVNASGQLGTVYNTQVISGSTFNASATDAEGNTITYSILSGSLPGSGLTLSSSTGMITGTLSGTPSLGNYSFIVQASTTEGVINRQFSLQVVPEPFSATGGTVTTVGGYRYHTFNSSGSFVTAGATSSDVEYLCVAGGGSGGGYGGGGGAGGAIDSNQTFSAGVTYTVTIGSGGAAFANHTQQGNDGTSSSISGTGISTVSSTGGGGGGTASSNGKSGGSGGGGGYNSAGGAGTAGQGNAGANAFNNSDPYASGGGGGKGGAGNTNSGANVAGAGGTGINWKSLGTFYAGGGGGGVAGGSGYTQNGVLGAGGSGGGGSGQWGGYTAATAGGNNTGGGGGGGGYNGSISQSLTGAGGSGVVILRYLFS